MSENPLNFIHRFIPGSARSPVPVLLLLHGTGGYENDLLDLAHALSPGSAFLSPRGKILENGMPRFFRRLAEGVFDEPDLIQRTHELADFVEAAAQEYKFDPSRVVAVGYSNGANIAASTVLLRPSTLKGAILLRAMVPLVPPLLPDLSGRPVFLSAGTNDPIIPAENVERLAALLRQAGANLELVCNSTGHQLGSKEIVLAQH